MTLRKNDRRRTITPAAARAVCYALTRIAEKVPADLLGTLLVEAGECWRGARWYETPRFYWHPSTGSVRYRTLTLTAAQRRAAREEW